MPAMANAVVRASEGWIGAFVLFDKLGLNRLAEWAAKHVGRVEHHGDSLCDAVDDSVLACVGVPVDERTYAVPGLEIPRDLVFEPIDRATFTSRMVLAVVEIDNDHTAYVLVPKDCATES